jgi:hypothetical protein
LWLLRAEGHLTTEYRANFGGVGLEPNDKLFSTVGEQQEGCMIGAVFEPKALSRNLETLSSWQMHRAYGH